MLRMKAVLFARLFKMKKIPIIVRKGKKQEYDEKKIYASCYAAALFALYPEKKAEAFAQKVTKKITLWVQKKGSVTSAEIKTQMMNSMTDANVALAYKHHLDLS